MTELAGVNEQDLAPSVSVTVSALVARENPEAGRNLGRVEELPWQRDHGIDLIRRFLALRDRANLRMIRETKERAEHALNISVNANEGYLLFQTRTERLIYLGIREPSVLMAFYDYLESMKPEELCTEEEMLERVEAILHEFVACHSREGSI